LDTLLTTDGKTVEVVDTGLYNRTDSGPDFFNAKIKIDGILWVGNVEIHTNASDWFHHKHDNDSAYNNVILHVVENADSIVTTTDGTTIPTLVIPIAKELRENYAELLNSEKYPPCYKIIEDLPHLKVHAWLSALQTERLERKTRDIEERVKRMNGSWEDAYFATLARNHGYGVNSEAFEEWAKTMPLSAVSHHRDDLFQIEALFLGQAGLLDHVEQKYSQEYSFLKKKFHLTPMDGSRWKYKTRPQNHPHVRLMQLAQMYHEHKTGLRDMLACRNTKDISSLYDFHGDKVTLFTINTVVPTMFAYGRHHAKDELCDRALDILESLPAEDNNIVRMWQECGLEVRTAYDSQSLLQLKKEYCDKKECLRCRFGYEFLQGEYKNSFFN
jgi:hypothetical protein